MSTASQATSPVWSVESGPAPVQLVELYSSQGCSSCPPAERFMTSLLESDDLFVRRVPLNFHVTYWDRLGWPDRHARREYTDRQYAHVRALDLPSAYTPGFIVDGREWRGFFSGRSLPDTEAEPRGELRARIARGELALEFTPSASSTPPSRIDFHVALLGVGLCDEIRAGENRGRELRQDFLVLSMQTMRGAPSDDAGAFAGRLDVPSASAPRPERHAIAAWVTPAGELAPLQAVGGWIDASHLGAPATTDRAETSSCEPLR